MPIIEAAVAAIAAAIAAETITAAAVVGVSTIVGVTGLAVSAVGMVTKNPTLMKVGGIMGMVGAVGGAAGGLAGILNAGESAAGSAGNFFAAPDVAGDITASLESAAGSAPVGTGTVLAPATSAPMQVGAGSVLAPLPEAVDLTDLAAPLAQPGNPAIPSSLANQQMPQEMVDYNNEQNVLTNRAPIPQAEANLAGQTQVATVAPAETSLAAQTRAATDPSLNLDSLPKLDTSSAPGRLDFMNTAPSPGTGASSGSMWDWVNKLEPWQKAQLGLVGGQMGAGLIGGLFQGYSAAQQLELQQLINQQNQAQREYQNRNNAYAPQIRFTSPSGPTGLLARRA